VEDDAIRCFYHGWKYDGSGQCIEQPGEKEKQFAAKVKIRSYPVEEYLGLIFAFLGEGEAPPMPRYPDWERVGIGGVRKHFRACNFFSYMENHPDPAHTPFVHHTRYYGTWNIEDMPEISSEEMEWGSVNHVQYMPIAGGEEGWTRLTAMGMPNIHEKRSGNPHRTAVGSGITATEAGEAPDQNKLADLMWNMPIDDESQIEYTVYPVDQKAASGRRNLGHVEEANMRAAELIEEILAGKLTIEEAEATALKDPLGNPFSGEGLFGLQDGLAQVGQGRIAPREADHLGNADEGIIMLRKLWRQELRKLAEGMPLTEWYRPEWFYGSY
jgi:5,5'-dehydrodivanillate O-demethylase